MACPLFVVCVSAVFVCLSIRVFVVSFARLLMLSRNLLFHLISLFAPRVSNQNILKNWFVFPCPAPPVTETIRSYGGAAVGAAFLPHDVAAQESDGEEEDGQDDATARELVPIHARLLCFF